MLLELPKAFEFTMLGHAAGGGEFSFRNGSTLFGLAQVGYPFIFPYKEIRNEIHKQVLKIFIRSRRVAIDEFVPGR